MLCSRWLAVLLVLVVALALALSMALGLVLSGAMPFPVTIQGQPWPTPLEPVHRLALNVRRRPEFEARSFKTRVRRLKS